MKRKDYIYIGAYLIFFGWFVNTIVEEKQYQNEQFEKINKLNNDLITISNYLDKNIKDISNNNNQIEYISIQLEELREDLKYTQNSAESFYKMFFSVFFPVHTKTKVPVAGNLSLVICFLGKNKSSKSIVFTNSKLQISLFSTNFLLI